MTKLRLLLKENHEALWNWLAKNPDKEKIQWPGWRTISILLDLGILQNGQSSLRFHCFACEKKGHGWDSWENCDDDCPIIWGGEQKRYTPACFYCGSFYSMFNRAEGKERSEWARKIAKGWVR